MSESFGIERGYLVSVPIYDSHKRAKNWMAVISLDPKSPGGLARQFAKRGHGDYYYSVEDIKIGDVLEFGADYYSSSGRKSPSRKYAVVLKISSNEMELELFDTSRKAFDFAEKFKEKKGIEDVKDDEKDEKDDDIPEFYAFESYYNNIIELLDESDLDKYDYLLESYSLYRAGYSEEDAVEVINSLVNS